MFTNDEVKPTRVYRVLFEHIPTGIMDHVYVESTSSHNASTSVIDKLGKEYDLIICVSIKKTDLN